MRSVAAAILLLVAAPLLAGDGKQSHSISFHSEGSASDGESRVFPYRIGAEQKFFRLSPDVTHINFKAFAPFRSEDGGSFGAAFFLDSSGAQRPMQVSSARQGAYLLSVIDGVPNDFVLIDKPIRDGVLILWSGMNNVHLEFLQDELKLPLVRNRAEIPR